MEEQMEEQVTENIETKNEEKAGKYGDDGERD